MRKTRANGPAPAALRHDMYMQILLCFKGYKLSRVLLPSPPCLLGVLGGLLLIPLLVRLPRRADRWRRPRVHLE